MRPLKDAKPLGVAHVPSPRQNVVPDAAVPLFRLVTGRFPVTPPFPLAARFDAVKFVPGIVPDQVMLPALTPKPVGREVERDGTPAPEVATIALFAVARHPIVVPAAAKYPILFMGQFETVPPPLPGALITPPVMRIELLSGSTTPNVEDVARGRRPTARNPLDILAAFVVSVVALGANPVVSPGIKGRAAPNPGVVPDEGPAHTVFGGITPLCANAICGSKINNSAVIKRDIS